MEDEEEDESVTSMGTVKPTTLTSPSFAFPGDQEPLDIFICSESGKPIYAYNKGRDEEFVVTLTGLIQALVNFFKDALKGEELKSITTISGLRITFSVKTPLILVLVTAVTSPVDPILIINQVYAQIVSIITFKTLKDVFDKRPTYDLRHLLGGSEKLLDALVDEGLLKNQLSLRRKVIFRPPQGNIAFDNPPAYLVQGYLTSLPNNLLQGGPLLATPSSTTSASTNNPNNPLSVMSSCHLSKHLTSRCLIPVLPLNPATRESVTNALASSVSSTKSSVFFALLFLRRLSQSANEVLPGSESIIKVNPNTEIDLESNLLIAIHNKSPEVAKLNPLDIQLLSTLIVASEGQLSAAECLWLPVCVPRVESSAFIHGHVSYLSQSGNPSPAVSPSKSSSASSSSSSTSHIQEKLCLLLLTTDREDFNRCQHIRDTLSERLNKVRFTNSPFTGLNVSCPHLDMFAYLSIKPHCIVYRNIPCASMTSFHPLVHYVSARMISSGYKTFWLQSDDHRVSLLGWHSATFVIYFQFDSCVTHAEALAVASNVQKWIRKEEEKIKLKDYQ